MPRAADSPTRKPGKAAGTGGHRDAVEGGKGDAGLLDHARDQRHQRLGMAALHRLRFLRDQLAGVGVEHAGGAGIERGVDGEDQHETTNQRIGESRTGWHGSSHAISSRHVALEPIRRVAHIGRTSTTSGTKCFSRFWMPCCSVAVDDGQPAQEPFMLR